MARLQGCSGNCNTIVTKVFTKIRINYMSVWDRSLQASPFRLGTQPETPQPIVSIASCTVCASAARCLRAQTVRRSKI